jgi:hypothetical protein
MTDLKFEQASYVLAVKLEQLAAESNENAAVVVKACCWVLGGLVVQASRDGDTSMDNALRTITDQLIACTARLAADGLQSSGRVQ